MGKRKFTTIKINEQPLGNQQFMPTPTQANENFIYSHGMVQPAQNSQGIMHSGSQANGKASCRQGIMQPPQGNQQNMNSETQANGEDSCSQVTQLTNKNTRGPTRMESVWKLPNNEKIPLETNVNFQPCFKNLLFPITLVLWLEMGLFFLSIILQGVKYLNLRRNMYLKLL